MAKGPVSMLHDSKLLPVLSSKIFMLLISNNNSIISRIWIELVLNWLFG